MLLLSVKAGRQMGAVRRRLDGGGRAGTGGLENPALTRGHPDQPPRRPEGGGSVDGCTLRLEPSARPHGDATKARPEEQAIKERGRRARMI